MDLYHEILHDVKKILERQDKILDPFRDETCTLGIKKNKTKNK